MLNVSFTDIECGGGFYVRSLVDDLGKGELNSVISAFIGIATKMKNMTRHGDH